MVENSSITQVTVSRGGVARISHANTNLERGEEYMYAI